MLKTIGPLAAGVAVVVAAGALYGIQTDRWRSSARLEEATAALDRVPAACGNWRATDVEYSAEDMARAGIRRAVFRLYRDARERETVTVLLVCGRGGPISVHTPDVCYAGAGYRQGADARAKDVEWADGRKGSFRVARFGKPGAASQLEIYWGWSRDGRTWEAPENPRLSFARLPALYKLYVVREFVPGTRDEKTDSCQNFLCQALPEFAQALAPGE